ncbi:hypothetical protein [Streptomyces sp. IBSBF 3136]|uniref:hypothetical protein n=1 Tax=Streptomyces sp. IBSBF 3136 TaxID=2903524 RepID=UPI002FDBE0CE
MRESELRRLRTGLGAHDGRHQLLHVRVRFTAGEPAQVVADARATGGLTRVVERVGARPAFERWPRLPPSWFAERRAPEPVEPESLGWP